MINGIKLEDVAASFSPAYHWPLHLGGRLAEVLLRGAKTRRSALPSYLSHFEFLADESCWLCLSLEDDDDAAADARRHFRLASIVAMIFSPQMHLE